MVHFKLYLSSFLQFLKRADFEPHLDTHLCSISYLHTQECNSLTKIKTRNIFVTYEFISISRLAALAQIVACLPLVQQVRGSIPGGVVNFNVKIFNLGARLGGDVHFLIARLYIAVLD